MGQYLRDLRAQAADDQVAISPAERGEEFRVPTNGVANTDPLAMATDAFEKWVAAIEATNPTAATEWREKRAHAEAAKVVVGESDVEPDEQDEPATSKVEQSPTTEPYDFDHCTITIGIQLLPTADGSGPSERPVIVGVRNHNDPPIIRFATLAEITSPVVIANLLTQLRSELPAREQACRERETKARTEEEARQQKLAAMKTKREKKRSNPLMAAAPPASAIVSTSGATLSQIPAIAPATANALALEVAPALSHVEQQSLF